MTLVDRIAPPGDRSRFIAEAIRHYAVEKRRSQLKRHAVAHASRP